MVGLYDATHLDLCKNLGCKVTAVKGDRSEAKNKLISLAETEWLFYLEPGEILSSGHEFISNLTDGPMRRIFVIQGDLISKEVRLWRKGDAKFVNPVYESLQPEEGNEPINVFVAGTESPDRLEDLLKWKQGQPNHREVDYYLACQYLVRKEYDKFFKHAEYFLFRESDPTFSVLMTRYYLGLIYLHVKKDSHKALENLIVCLGEKPLHAEFWCAVGDCYYRAGVPDKAIAFFENAMAMGRERMTNDPYPIELPKYNEYPIKMIELCKEIKRVPSSRSR